MEAKNSSTLGLAGTAAGVDAAGTLGVTDVGAGAVAIAGGGRESNVENGSFALFRCVGCPKLQVGATQNKNGRAIIVRMRQTFWRMAKGCFFIAFPVRTNGGEKIAIFADSSKSNSHTKISNDRRCKIYRKRHGNCLCELCVFAVNPHVFYRKGAKDAKKNVQFVPAYGIIYVFSRAGSVGGQKDFDAPELPGWVPT